MLSSDIAVVRHFLETEFRAHHRISLDAVNTAAIINDLLEIENRARTMEDLIVPHRATIAATAVGNVVALAAHPQFRRKGV